MDSEMPKEMETTSTWNWRHWAGCLLAISISFGMLKWTGRLDAKFEPDSQAYLQHDWSSWQNALSGIRTPGYPAFLWLVTSIADPSAIPLAHWIAGVTAGSIFIWGLLMVGFRPGPALAAGSVLFVSRSLWDMGSAVASDSLAITCSVAATGVFFGTLALPSRRRYWIALGVLTLTTYLIRPAFLFLIVLWPTLGPWLRYGLFDRSWTQAIQKWIAYTALTVGIFLGYCAFRWTMTGEFGLVSFGGYNLIGVSGQYLDEADIEGLPEQYRELARRMIARRVDIDDYRPPDTFETMVYLYNATVWKSAVPAAESLYGQDVARINQELKGLAGQLVRSHPREYRNWLLSNARYDVEQVVTLTATDLGTRLALIGFVIAVLYSFWFNQSRQGKAAILDARPMRFELQMLFWTACVFALGKGLLVILVEPALGRYVSASMCLMPSLVALCIWHICMMLRPAA